MTLYMLCCCIVFQHERGMSALSLVSAHTSSLLYMGLFGIAIPVIGCVQPTTLGTYFGGYRMATFHFAGNETYRALLIRKDSIPAAHGDNSCLGRLLRARALGYERITEDADLF